MKVRLSSFEYIEQNYNNYNLHFVDVGLIPNQKEKESFKN